MTGFGTGFAYSNRKKYANFTCRKNYDSMKYIPFFLLLLWTIPVRSQQSLSDSLQQRIRAEMNAYFNAVEARDWNAVLDRMPPALFHITPRDEILKSFDNASNRFTDYQTHRPTSVRIFPQIQTGDTARYVLIGYQKNATWIFRPKDGEPANAFKHRMDYVFYRLQKTYGKGHVTQGSRPGIFHLRIPSYMVAIVRKTGGRIFFVDFPTDMRRQVMLHNILPQPVVLAFNNLVFAHKS